MKYTLSVVVENQPAVLSRVVSLFSRRGYNIDSLTVSAGEDPAVSRMTIVGEGDGYTVEQVEKQLNKLIPVIKVRRVDTAAAISGELMFVKVGCDKAGMKQVNEIVALMGAQVAEVTGDHITVKFAGSHAQCETLLQLLRPTGIREIARTGLIAMEK